MVNKILTYSLAHHKSLFTEASSKNDYFYIQTTEHPYISEPYRAESYAIEFLRKGSIIMQSQLEKVVVEAPAIIALGPSVIRGFSKNSDEILIDIIFFKPQFFLKNQADVLFLAKYSFFENSNVCRLSDANEQKFEQLFNLIKETSDSQSAHQAAILRSYLYVLIYELDDMQQKIEVSGTQNPLFEKFKTALFKDFLSQRSVRYYADLLNVSRKYLSETVKKNSGKTAGEWIDEIIILEAKVLLQHKNLTISEISNQLNFPDQSSFGRFFKNQTGIPPLEYRKNL
ncbi:helix-turn-helix domain-containing protein [Flavobacterium foetidum]|uniref:helix-turn-helix domain-containing protein n=1 Tax=Flavobacterium foetidum TaxID=2026681 RepID=UPI00107524EE|nr:helix-turn-helix domain-containing protein [Flavobacterium foetidum]KAF2507398.1 AraC family transcriptional regulator [Flavobacterium foetidum]